MWSQNVSLVTGTTLDLFFEDIEKHDVDVCAHAAVLAAVATESAQRFEVSVSTHKVDMKISRLPYDVRKAFIELHLPPTGSTNGGKSLGSNTTEFIGIYDHVIEEALKLQAIKDEEITKRDAVCKKVQYVATARPWTLLWIVTGGVAFNRSSSKVNTPWPRAVSTRSL